MDSTEQTPQQQISNEDRLKLLEKMFADRREYWMKWVEDMTKCLRDMNKLVDLQVDVYSRRQEAVENYHSLSNILAKRTRAYKDRYAEIYKTLRPLKLFPGSPTLMYSTEKSIADQIEAHLSQDKYIIDLTSSQMEYMEETIKTIDGIIYSIANRIKIEEINIGR